MPHKLGHSAIWLSQKLFEPLIHLIGVRVLLSSVTEAQLHKRHVVESLSIMLPSATNLFGVYKRYKVVQSVGQGKF